MKKGEKQAEVYKLNVLDRMNLLRVLPKQGDIATLRINRELRESLALTEKEAKAIDYRAMPDGATMVDVKKAQALVKGFQLGPIALGIIKDTLKAMNDAKPPTLGLEHINLYETFVEKKAA